MVNAYIGPSSLTYLSSQQQSYEEDSIIILILQMNEVRINQRIKYLLKLASDISGIQSLGLSASDPLFLTTVLPPDLLNYSQLSSNSTRHLSQNPCVTFLRTYLTSKLVEIRQWTISKCYLD